MMELFCSRLMYILYRFKNLYSFDYHILFFFDEEMTRLVKRMTLKRHRKSCTICTRMERRVAV